MSLVDGPRLFNGGFRRFGLRFLGKVVFWVNFWLVVVEADRYIILLRYWRERVIVRLCGFGLDNGLRVMKACLDWACHKRF